MLKVYCLKLSCFTFASEMRCFEFCFQGNDDLIIVHEALNFGDCHLSLAVCSRLK